MTDLSSGEHSTLTNIQPGDRVAIYGTDREGAFNGYETHPTREGTWARVTLDCGAVKLLISDYVRLADCDTAHGQPDSIEGITEATDTEIRQ